MTSTRRDVLHTIGLAAATTLIPACGGGGDTEGNVPLGSASMCGADLCLKLSDNSELQAVGGIMMFTQAPGKKILVQRTSDTTLLSLSAICTHAGCTVNFNGEDKLNCPCHGSSFAAASGAVLNGPAGAPLRSFPTVIAGDDVTISLA